MQLSSFSSLLITIPNSNASEVVFLCKYKVFDL